MSNSAHNQTVRSLESIDQICSATLKRTRLSGLSKTMLHNRIAGIQHNVRMLLVEQAQWADSCSAQGGPKISPIGQVA